MKSKEKSRKPNPKKRRVPNSTATVKKLNDTNKSTLSTMTM